MVLVVGASVVVEVVVLVVGASVVVEVVVLVVGASVVVEVVVLVGAAVVVEVVVLVIEVQEKQALVTVATGLPLIIETETTFPPNETYQVPVPAAANIAPVNVVELQKSTLSPYTVAEAKNPQASSAAPPNPIKNVGTDVVVEVVVLVGEAVVVLVVVLVGAAVVVVVVVEVVATPVILNELLAGISINC